MSSTWYSSTFPSPIDKTAQICLKKKGFDLDDVNKICDIGGWGLTTPVIYFCYHGNLKMCRYVHSRGADCRIAGPEGSSSEGEFPMVIAARYGRGEIGKWLYHDAGAQEDIRRVDDIGTSPLAAAMRSYAHAEFRHGIQRYCFAFIQFCILNGALAPPHHDVDGGCVDDMVMRNDLDPEHAENGGERWDDDKRRAIRSWAHDAVTKNKRFQSFLMGTIITSATSSSSSSSSSSSPLITLQGKSDVLELIADYTGITKSKEMRIFRQLIPRLSAFIDEVPFVPQSDETPARERDIIRVPFPRVPIYD